MILWTMAVTTSYKQSNLFQFHAVKGYCWALFRTVTLARATCRYCLVPALPLPLPLSCPCFLFPGYWKSKSENNRWYHLIGAGSECTAARYTVVTDNP